MITHIGKINIPQTILDHAETIKLENYKTNSPAKFQKHSQYSTSGEKVSKQLSKLLNVDLNKIDWVYFSACKGAEPHVDQLDPNKFNDETYVVPIILPEGESKIQAIEDEKIVELFNVYHFDHTKIHSMTLEDNDSGCVVLMCGIRIDT